MNKYQTKYTEEYINNLPEEVKEQYYDCVNNIPYIKYLLSSNRQYARDLSRDSENKIIIDITKPHILEDMDYFRPTALHYQKYGCYTKIKPNANPNSEYRKWLMEEVKRCWEGYVRPSDGEWITGDYYFFLNYCPIQLIKKDKNGKTIRTVDFPKVWDGHYLKSHYLKQCRDNGSHAAELASRGKGKAHPYKEIVYTPNGKKLWKDIKIGDLLYTENGGITKVVDIPFDDKAPIYEIRFSNGEIVRCSEGHLWEVINHGKILVLSTLELLQRLKKNSKKSSKYHTVSFIVNTSKGIEMPKKTTTIDPYTFGLFLGDKCTHYISQDRVCLSSSEEDFHTYKELIPYKYTKGSNKHEWILDIQGFTEYLKSVDMYISKPSSRYIPDEYKYNSRNVRIALLRGFLDAVGVITKGRIELLLTSERLIDDIKWILASLGINYVKRRIKNAFYYDGNKNKVTCNTAYKLSIFSDIKLFNLVRKIHLWRKNKPSKCKGIKIINIKYVGEQKSKCVTVDNHTHKYLIGNFIPTHNSFFAASMLAKRFILGESEAVNKKVQCVATASERKYIQGANQILDMFQYYIDFCANNTEFPRQRITSSLQNLSWTMGYVDSETNTRRGTENSVIGITSKDDESKLRGSRGVLYLLEEAGSFPRLLNLYQVLRPSVEDGNSVWGTIFLYGTAGDSTSDFSSMQELMYNPEGYNIYKIPNVYDKEGQGRKWFTYFFPGYLNRAECYDENGNSDVNKALIEILLDRYKVKYNSTDINAITKRIAEIPITPQEAILKTKGNIFPIADLTKRLNQIDNDPNFFDSVYIGDLVFSKKGKVEFSMSNELPIREFPTKDNKVTGALEIYEMPQEVHGVIPSERYIVSLDNYENDEAQSMSLGSMLVLDLWSDRIVAEYTGRPQFVDDLNEVCRKLCLFYNARVMVENNKKNTFAYFSKMNSLHLMADTPKFLRNKQIVKTSTFGNSSKGCPATVPVINFAMERIKDWLLKPVTTTEEVNGETLSVTVPNLYFLKNRALIKELLLYNPNINVDRIMSLCQLIIYREEKMILYQGDPMKNKDRIPNDYLGNDDFFNNNYRQ